MSGYQIVDPYGRPISSAELLREEAAPTLTGVRSIWSEPVASGLTPARLARILRDAVEGEAGDYLALAEEMEERDLHYAAVLGTRKRAVLAIEPVVNEPKAGPVDEKILDAVRELIEAPDFEDMLIDLLDALGKGFSVVEILWERGKIWRPRGYVGRDPRHFQFDRKTGRELRLREDGSADGREISRYSFIRHVPKLKSGLPIRGGLARLAAWAFLLKSYTLKDWAAFLEVFGMPMRVGRYPRSATPDEKRVLLRAVRDLGADAAAIIPTGMDVEFIEAKGGSGNAVFGAMAEYLDAQISKAVLGQTMTTDDGSSLAQAQVHENVRYDILRADGRQVSTTLNRDLVQPFVAFNFGPQERYPTVDLPVAEAEDIETLSEALTKLVPLGLRVSSSEVRDKVGLGAPKDEDDVLRAPGAGQPEATPSGDPQLARACPHCGGVHATARAGQDQDELDALLEGALQEWGADLAPVLEQLQEAFAAATSYEDLRARLDRLSGALDVGPIARRLADLAMIARGLGDAG
ncbi:DUF935 domain-containing protein [Polymorphum gilvum]|uniref:Mu-like prophage protein gp29 n=1 Tax=Polymorphum gilvum (strain LMG 25793 / CGMCC 1.9160 / SL003B-26A1) TaxID=991905 RepID=F2J648_POLGS|nr:DUF935 domain-containing protein [Polymorphum gilvum]ADZ72412.1 Mu-like prophage protein gp29 [Polymorphum gilvum SL003B-26A1]